MVNRPEVLLFSFFKDFIYLFIFKERGRERGRKGEKHPYVVASRTPPTGDLACNPGIWPATQACGLTGNLTSDPLVYRPVLNPLSHPSQGLRLCSSLIS